MRLAAPAGLAALVLALPLALWYLLKARRPRVEVSSTFLWRRHGESVTAAVPWQRLRPDATFWLILAAVVALALALARPWQPVPPTLGEHTVIVVDASASMLADEGGPSRLELARRQATALVEGMAAGQTVSVIEAGLRARVVQSSATDPGTVLRALDGVRPGQGPADLAGAFALVESVLQPSQPTLTYLFTDREIGPVDAAAAPAGLGVVPVGTGLGNLAVTQLQATPTGVETAQVYASVRNFGREPAEALLRIATDDAELASRTVEIAARETTEIVLDVNVSGRELIRGTVEDTAGERSTEPADVVNALAVDDTALAVASGTRDVTALVAGPGNVFVESALASVGGVTVTTAEAVPEDLTGVDLLVVDRVPAPEEIAVPTLLLAATVLPDGIAAAPAEQLPAVTYQDPDHPLLQGVDLSEIAIASARPARGEDIGEAGAPSTAATVTTGSVVMETVVGGPVGSLVLAGRIAGQPVVYVGFDLLASNLPLDVSWPVFTSNAVSWLAGGVDSPALRVGEAYRVDLPAGVPAAEARSPSGITTLLDATRPLLRPGEVGVWQLAWQGPAELVDAAPPAPVLAVNAVVEEGDLLAPPPEESAPVIVGAGEAPPAGRRVVGPVLLVVLLALLVVDWLAAHRRDLRVPRLRRRRRPA